MLFICEGVLTESTAEGILSVFSLFRELEHRTILGPGKYDFLKEVLVSVGRNDLASMLATITRKSMMPTGGKSIAHFCSNKKSILMHISTQLRKADVRKMAYLCCCKSERGLSLIEELEHKNKISDNNYDYLACRLSEIGRHDLAQFLLINARKETANDELSVMVQRMTVAESSGRETRKGRASTMACKATAHRSTCSM